MKWWKLSLLLMGVMLSAIVIVKVLPVKQCIDSGGPNITMAEMSMHNSSASCWMALHGKVYDFTPYLKMHQGGNAILEGCGKDATFLFETKDLTRINTTHSMQAREMHKCYYKGELQTPAPYCGDSICDNTENCSTCPGDCGPCVPDHYCADGVCDADETCGNCSLDCGNCPIPPVCGNHICEQGEDVYCPPCTYSNPPCMVPCTTGTCPQDCIIPGNKSVFLVMTSAQMDTNDLQNYVSWRSDDFNVRVVHADGYTPARVKQAINDNNASYVLLAGGSLHVPTDSVRGDSYYSDTNDDLITDLPVGRWTVRNATELHDIITKTMSFENQKQYNVHGALFVAGSEAVPPAYGWKTATYFETEARPVFSSWNVQPFYCNGNPANYTNPLVDNMDYPQAWFDTVTIVGFGGHSTLNGYLYMGCPNRSYMLLSAGIQNLNNTHYPILVSFSCQAATTTASDDYAPVITMNQEHGFIAVIGPVVSGGTFPKSVWQHLISDMRLGDAYVNSMNDVSYMCEGCDLYYQRRTLSSSYMLMGDPAMRIN